MADWSGCDVEALWVLVTSETAPGVPKKGHWEGLHSEREPPEEKEEKIIQQDCNEVLGKYRWYCNVLK